MLTTLPEMVPRVAEQAPFATETWPAPAPDCGADQPPEGTVIDTCPSPLSPCAVNVNVSVLPGLAATMVVGDVATDMLNPAAALYGPTNGPPLPTGGAPAGWTKSVPVSASARAMLMRPLPVWSWVPAGSAMRARRPTVTPVLRVGAIALMKGAGPATIAADADVPLMMV